MTGVQSLDFRIVLYRLVRRGIKGLGEGNGPIAVLGATSYGVSRVSMYGTRAVAHEGR